MTQTNGERIEKKIKDYEDKGIPPSRDFIWRAVKYLGETTALILRGRPSNGNRRRTKEYDATSETRDRIEGFFESNL